MKNDLTIDETNKKKYFTPLLEVEVFSRNDIVVCSDDDDDGEWDPQH